MASTSPLNELEDQVKDLLLTEFNQTAKVDSLPTEEDLEYTVDYIVQRIDKRYPYLLVIADQANEVAADSTLRQGEDNVQFSIYVAVAFDGNNELQGQRRKATDWCQYVRAAVQGKRVNGGTFTSKRPIQGFDMERIFNLEGMALYRTGFAVNIHIDNDDVTLP